MKTKLFTLVFACLTFLTSSVFAKEVINSFDSLIQVQTDGSMIVTETITVHHEGVNIRRGIYRDLPTKNGVKYELISVKRNNLYEPSFVEKRRGYYRINTGDDSFLPNPGTSAFEIKYRVWNVPQSYNGFDEVYWNVTGDEWAFSIENVSARVELPLGADIIQEASYIGYKGSKESAIYEGNGQYRGGYLSPGEQLTIAVGFTPGIVSTEKYVYKKGKYNNHILFIAYFVYLSFLIFIWFRIGRDPVGNQVVPQYEPPAELTAAQAACLYDMDVKKNVLAISFVQMISNGFLKLTVETRKTLFVFPKKVYILEKTGKAPSNAEESHIYWRRKTLDGQYDYSLSEMGRHIAKTVKRKMLSYYSTNREWVLIPTFLMALLISFMLFYPEDTDVLVADAGLSLGILLINYAYSFVSSILFSRKLSVHLSIFALIMPFILFLVSPLIKDFGVLVVLFLLTGITSSVFTFLLYRPTRKGLRLIEHLEGLRLFLKSKKSRSKEKFKFEEVLSKENMEKLFPYALALGLEKEWEKKFEDIFGPTEHVRFVHAHPYTGHNFARAFSSSTSCSSGGSGGGGGAGGGCGGGGGGGR